MGSTLQAGEERCAVHVNSGEGLKQAQTQPQRVDSFSPAPPEELGPAQRRHCQKASVSRLRGGKLQESQAQLIPHHRRS